jgi:hypothetical protein
MIKHPAMIKNQAIDILFKKGEFVVFCSDAFHAGHGGGPPNMRFFCYADANRHYQYGSNRIEGSVMIDNLGITYLVDDERYISSEHFFANF